MGSIESRIRIIGYAASAAALLACAGVSRADEAGGSFWLPGQYASLAAVPQTPGWALTASYYHSNVAAAGNVAAAREIRTGRIPGTVKVNLNLEPERAIRSGHPRAVVYFCDAGSWRTVVRGHVQPVRPKRQQHRRNAHSTGRSDRGDALRNARRLANLLRRPRTERDAALERWRQQLSGLWRRQHSCRRL